MTSHPETTQLSQLDGAQFCRLGVAHTALCDASARLLRDPRVSAVKGIVKVLDGEECDDSSVTWTATVATAEGQETVRSQRVLLVPGAEPRRGAIIGASPLERGDDEWRGCHWRSTSGGEYRHLAVPLEAGPLPMVPLGTPHG